jgi:hypothetical protein
MSVFIPKFTPPGPSDLAARSRCLARDVPGCHHGCRMSNMAEADPHVRRLLPHILRLHLIEQARRLLCMQPRPRSMCPSAFRIKTVTEPGTNSCLAVVEHWRRRQETRPWSAPCASHFAYQHKQLSLHRPRSELLKISTLYYINKEPRVGIMVKLLPHIDACHKFTGKSRYSCSHQQHMVRLIRVIAEAA